MWNSFAFDGFTPALDALRAMLQAGVRPGVVRLYDAAETSHKFAGLGLEPEACVLVLVYEGLRELAETSAVVGGRFCERAGGRDLGRGPAERWWQTRFDTSGMVLANSRPGGISAAQPLAGRLERPALKIGNDGRRIEALDPRTGGRRRLSFDRLFFVNDVFGGQRLDARSRQTNCNREAR